jgi:hypothetical protein
LPVMHRRRKVSAKMANSLRRPAPRPRADPKPGAIQPARSRAWALAR